MRRVTAILVAIIMAFTVLPLGGESAYGKAKAPEIKKIKFRGRVVTTGGKISEGVVSDSLKEAKAMVLEYIEAVYEEMVYDKSHYCDAVWKEIHTAYDNAIAAVEGAKSVRDLYSTDGLFLYLEPKIGEELEIIEVLADYIKHYIKDSGDLKTMKSDFIKYIRALRKMLNKQFYNDFYWGKLQNIFYDVDARMNKVKSFRDYILTASEILNTLTFAGVDEEDDEGLVEMDDEDADSDGILISLIEDDEDDEWLLLILGEEEGDPIYNKYGVETARLSVVDKLELYVSKRLPQAKYKGNTKALKKEIENFKKKVLDKMEDVEAIYKAGDNKLAELIKKTGIDCPDITRKSFLKVAKEYNALTNDYNEYNYSTMQWLKIEMQFMAAKSTIEYAEKEYEIYGVIGKLKQELNKIPTAKKEFESIKAKAEKKLKSYLLSKNKKKYNQAKVKVVIKNGLAALAKIKKYDVEELNYQYSLYVYKAENCIKKFKIKTSRKGKGTITKSTTVEYGGKCTIKLMPKAGYKIKKVLINGKKAKLKNKYVFKNVKKTQKIKAIFGK